MSRWEADAPTIDAQPDADAEEAVSGPVLMGRRQAGGRLGLKLRPRRVVLRLAPCAGCRTRGRRRPVSPSPAGGHFTWA